MFRKFCTVEIFLKAVWEVDVVQILGSLSCVVRAVALLMPQTNLDVHRVVHEHKTSWAVFAVKLTQAGKRSQQHLKLAWLSMVSPHHLL